MAKRLALVIDDSRATRKILCRILAEVGFDSVEAGNGQEALERLAETPGIVLALVDWNMPVMNGLEFIRAVRARAGYQHLTMMMVTTETEMSQMVRALAAGANEYVMKPFTRDIILDKLQLLGLTG